MKDKWMTTYTRNYVKSKVNNEENIYCPTFYHHHDYQQHDHNDDDDHDYHHAF
jgi:hypothetical protein